MIFTSFGRLLTFLGLVFVAVFVFFYFHGAVASLYGDAGHAWKIASGQAHIPVFETRYDVKTEKNPDVNDSSPVLPDISRYTVENIAARAPAYAPGGKIFIRNMSGLAGLREFVKKDGRIQHIRLGQNNVDPKAIVIQDGAYDFAHLYEEVQSLAPDQAIRREGNTYTLLMPIFVGHGASLVISDKDAAEVRLSQDSNAFIANSGNLFILRTKITGWNDNKHAPAPFENQKVYRPFIATWSGSQLYIAGSKLSNLGYHKGKSYGLTYSTCIDCLQEDQNLSRPTGALVDNTFTNMYYGFYSYEADDVAIIGNKYINNVVYGIDPHDRSRRLIIAKNETYGSHKKHGIIISRDVNDSWIFDNYSHHNHGSGIMLDRNSHGNVIANNTTSYNDGDGITFFESSDNRTYNNTIYRNHLSGVRIRNSQNIVMTGDQVTDNGEVPVVLYSLNLMQSQPKRNLKEDPYQKKASASVSGAILKPEEKMPAFKVDDMDKLTLNDIHIISASKMFDTSSAVNGDVRTNSPDDFVVVARDQDTQGGDLAP